MGFPEVRLRRLRRNATLRRMVRETRFSVDDLVMPLFVLPGNGIRNPVTSLPGVYQLSVDSLVEEAKSTEALGIPAVLLFGIPESKDERGTSGYAPDGTVCRAIEALKQAVPKLCVIADVCLCEYTDHGHCGVLHGNKDGVPEADNDATLELLAKQALAYARAGADVVAPSDMMDGRVGAIRSALDAADMSDIAIMAYSAKFASAFYGPFREAAGSTPQFGNRKSYQLDPPNAREALREIALDIEEGADIVMVKPALPCLDIIYRASQQFDVPLAGYSVSGEFAMVKAAAANGWIDEQQAVTEILTSIRRAGAKLIITYWAKDVAHWLDSPTEGHAT